MPSCLDNPYNINNLDNFETYIDSVDYTNKEIDFEFWQKCITKQKDISHVDLNLSSINTILNKYNIEEQERVDTANELNTYSLTLFQNDIYYTYGKIVFFIILICSYIYFFRINGIIQPIMNLFNFVKTKVMVDLPNTATKILDKKIPKEKANSIKTNSIKTNSIKTNSIKNKLSAT
jgi:hypothetical protein